MPPAGALRTPGWGNHEQGEKRGGVLIHPVCHRPRTSRADQGQGAKVVLPVGSSSLDPLALARSPEGGSTADGMIKMGRILETAIHPTAVPTPQPSERGSAPGRATAG
jgi:hypothetical protein